MLFIVDKITNALVGQRSDFITKEDEWLFLQENPTVYLLPTDNEVLHDNFDMYHLVDGEFVLKEGMDTDDPLVTSNEINRVRDFLHQTPLVFNGDSFDADDGSIAKMREIAEVVRDSDTLDWTLSDNRVKTFDGKTFKSVFRQIQYLRATRLYNHHAYSKTLKARLPEVKRSDLDLLKWGDGLID